MKKRHNLLTITFLCIGSLLFAQEVTHVKAEILTDLHKLKTELERYHPNLYSYSSKAEIDQWFSDKIQQLPNNLSELEAYQLISSISSLLRDGHSYIYPNAQHLKKLLRSAPIFPLEVFLTYDSLVVVENYSQNSSLPLGAVLTKINGIDSKEIQSIIVQHSSRDGDNMEYPKYIFYKFFASFYSYHYGFPKNFTVEYLNHEGQRKETILKALTREEIELKKPTKEEKGIDLQCLKNTQAAVLKIKSFDKEVLKKTYQQNFKKEIKKVFKLLEEKQIKQLAIDLRGNQGGDLSNGVFLLRHFMDSSFQCVNSFYTKKGKKRKKLSSKWDNYFAPKKKYHFNEEVYLFVNGGSFSCSAIFAHTVKKCKRGKILGKMSGGSAYLNTGGPNKVLILPETKISFTIPKTQYNLRKDRLEMGLGVIPDINIQDHPNRIIYKDDNYLKTFKHLIKE
ncbi:MAG: S41 family peptidase [Bacteroidota bacterium]